MRVKRLKTTDKSALSLNKENKPIFDFISTLPTDLSYPIFSHAGTNSLQLKLVSKFWNEQYRKMGPWYNYLQNYFPYIEVEATAPVETQRKVFFSACQHFRNRILAKSYDNLRFYLYEALRGDFSNIRNIKKREERAFLYRLAASNGHQCALEKVVYFDLYTCKGNIPIRTKEFEEHIINAINGNIHAIPMQYQRYLSKYRLLMGNTEGFFNLDPISQREAVCSAARYVGVVTFRKLIQDGVVQHHLEHVLQQAIREGQHLIVKETLNSFPIQPNLREKLISIAGQCNFHFIADLLNDGTIPDLKVKKEHDRPKSFYKYSC
jgi:hypothetical protein